MVSVASAGDLLQWHVAINRVLAHLGLSAPEEPKPPAAVHEVARVPVDEEGREIAMP